MTNQEIQKRISNLRFEHAWNICKAHKLFSDVSKATMQYHRAGVPAMKVWDLYADGLLTEAEKLAIGIK